MNLKMKRIASTLLPGKNLPGCLLLLGLLLITCSLRADTAHLLKQQEDSLLAVLSNTHNDVAKINILRNLVALSDFTPKEAAYATQMLELADKIDSISICYEAIFRLSRHYSNSFQLDSLCYWVQTLDSITTARNEMPQELLASHSALCRLYLIRKEYEAAMNEAVKQQIIAEKTNDQLGLAYCNEYWGLIYMFTFRYEEAVQALEKSVSILSKIDNRLANQLQVSNDLIRIYLFLKEYEKAEQALNEYERVLAEIEKSDNPTARKEDFYAMLGSLRIWLYSEMHMPQKAEEARKRMIPHEEALSFDYIAEIYNFGMASYYYTIKDYPKAYYYINRPNNIDIDILYFQKKIEILTALGKKDETLEANQQYLEHGKSEREISYTRQIDQLRSLQNLKEKEQVAQDLAIQEKELQNKHSQLQGFIILSCILLLSLVFWIWYLIRTKKLKNGLVKEQLTLKGINHDLQIAKERAEKTEKMKSNFIANISHEIRTPLNTIVGFADMLRDSDKEERTQYIHIINNNSDLLLNLVSDVLDLSRLSDEDFVLNIQPVNLEECCQHALSTVKHSIYPNVETVFTHPEKPFEMETDSLRLQQLLVNLLGNAAKFTEKGKITLDYTVDQDSSSVIYSVTDTGIGIPLEKQNLIFNRFEKANDIKQGTGLGLSICQAIAKRFGGHLSIDSTYTSGARFVFVMPIENQAK